jgi:hypothetical protein
LLRRWKNGGHHGFDEHAVAQGAVEVALALDAAIILARLLLQLDTDPFSDLEVGLAGEADDAFAAILKLDPLPRLEIGHYEMSSEELHMVACAVCWMADLSGGDVSCFGALW